MLHDLRCVVGMPLMRGRAEKTVALGLESVSADQCITFVLYGSEQSASRTGRFSLGKERCGH